MNKRPSRLLARVTPPATEPLTLAEAKLFLRVDGTAEDALITDLMVAARMAAEEHLRQSLITQSWKLAFDDYAPEETFLPRGPVTGITSVTQFARDGSSTLVSSSTYYLNAAKHTLIFDTVPLAFRVEIVYGTGYGDATAVPKPLKQGILAHMAAMYESRDEGAALPPAAVALYQPFRERML